MAIVGPQNREQLFLVGCVYSSTHRISWCRPPRRRSTSSELEEKGKASVGGEGGGGTSRNLGKGKHQEVEPRNTSQAPVTPFRPLRYQQGGEGQGEQEGVAETWKLKAAGSWNWSCCATSLCLVLTHATFTMAGPMSKGPSQSNPDTLHAE